MVSSCANESIRSVSIPGTWHFSKFSEVRAYRINWDDEYAFDPIINKDGKLNETRMPKEGVLLTKEQVALLESAVTGIHAEHLRAYCFYPHHAFVFYDDLGKVVGHINICFLCSNYSGEPKHFADYWNVDSLGELISGMGIPLKNQSWD